MRELMPEIPDAQFELGLELREPVPAPSWARAIEHETEGDQDTGWWDA